MTPRHLIILTEAMFQEPLQLALQKSSLPSDLRIEFVDSEKSLRTTFDDVQSDMRLVGFCTGVIIPSSVLKKCSAGALNFHPGPPEYPGLFPSCFAIYDGASTFGVTAHHITDVIDGGEIVAVERFPIPAPTERMVVDKMALEAVLKLFRNMLPRLINLSEDIPASGEVWLGPVRTKKDFEALCQLPEDVTEDEFNRRYRAVGEGPDHALSISLFGHRFRLDNARDAEDIIKAGVTASIE